MCFQEGIRSKVQTKMEAVHGLWQKDRLITSSNLEIFRGKKLLKTKLRIHHLLVKGHGQIDNLTVASSNHMGMFYSSADWLVRHQDSSGGWPIVFI